MKRLIGLALSLVMLLGLALVCAGDEVIEKIEAHLARDMKFKVDGELWQPKEIDGTTLSPIIYNGRSYVPVRALLEAKDVQVGYDEPTRTIILDYPEWNDGGTAAEDVLESPSDRNKETDRLGPIILNASENKGSDGEIITYNIQANKGSKLNQFVSETKFTFDLSENTKIIFNGREISAKEISEQGIAYAITEGINGNLIYEVNQNNNLITLIKFDGKELTDSDAFDGNTIVAVLKTRHETAKNSVSNIR